MQRITRNFLEAKATTINTMTKSPRDSSCIVDGVYVSNIGNYHISGAYGGYCLHQMVNESGAVNDVFDCGYIPAKQLAALMSAFIKGLFMASK
jgi:hypothetical protein